MKKLLLLFFLLAFCLVKLNAQCASGYTNAKLDWDFLDYFPSAGYSDGTINYTNLAHSQTQYFVLGGQRVQVTHNYPNSANVSALGENTAHTGEGNSYGTGADIQFKHNGVITISFEKAVSNVKFSIYDIDFDQRITIAALHGATGSNVLLSRASGTQLIITGNNTSSAVVTGPAGTAIANTSSDGTANVDIAGPVTSITLTITNTGTRTSGNASSREDGSFWISDISACTPTVSGGNYYQVAKPFNGQPGYVLVVLNNTIYYVNPVNGKAKYLFTDPGHGNINSLAYDPVNHYVYYVYSLTGPVVNGATTTNPNNKQLRRYDYNMDTLGVVLQDIGSIGAPTMESGVESGAAAFYNGSLYLGLEAKSSGDFESIIWKIDFDGANPYQASQQFAIDGAGHDWSDFEISNDVLYDFDGVSTVSARNIYHVNLMTGSTTTLTPSGFVPRQTSTDWQGQVYNVGSPDASATGEITPYLYNGTINTSLRRTITYNGVAISGSWGDAAGAFVPKVDFGDAPASYDAVGPDPAVHEIDTALYLGTSIDVEWNKRGTNAEADADIDNGLDYATILHQDGNYLSTVTVYNNTGADATLCAWLDFNGDGVFDANEGRTYTVPSNPVAQKVDLFWPSPSTVLPNNSYTYLRMRLTSSENNLTTAKPTGYMPNGEVEDYRVLTSVSVLDTRLLSFDAKKDQRGDVQVNWEVVNDRVGVTYELQKSIDGTNWATVAVKKPYQQNIKMNYSFLDRYPYYNVTYYRVKVVEMGISKAVSTVRKVITNKKTQVSFTPNPAYKQVRLIINTEQLGTAKVRVFSAAGIKLLEQSYTLHVGANSFLLPQIEGWAPGVYQVEVWIDDEKHVQKLILSK